jgi:hypothetical protein
VLLWRHIQRHGHPAQQGRHYGAGCLGNPDLTFRVDQQGVTPGERAGVTAA